MKSFGPVRLAGSLLVVAALVVPVSVVAQQPPAIGSVDYVRGAGAAQKPGESPRVLGAGSTIQQGEVLSTGASSFAIVKLNDGTRMTLRPNTSMKVDDFILDQPGKSDNLGMSLLKGGLRIVTGLISKRVGTSTLTTSTATVGIRGTDFDARLCAADCRAENRAPPTPVAQASTQTVLPASARVVQLQGGLVAVGENGERRQVLPGGPAYKGDVLETAPGAQAVLVFRDDTRVTVQGGTRMRIQDFKFDSKVPGEGSVTLNLIKGGIRALTGLIGKANPGAIKYSTATATVGIRGTGVDLNCEGACAGESPGGPTGGFFIFTWQGEATVSSGAAPTEVLIIPVGSAARLADGSLRPIMLTEIPAFMNNNPTIRPDRVNVDLNQLFGQTRQGDSEDGLYLGLRDGHLAVTAGGRTLDIGRGEVLFAGLDGSSLTRLEQLPLFLRNDPTPRPDQLDNRTTQLLDMLSLGLRMRANLTCSP